MKKIFALFLMLSFPPCFAWDFFNRSKGSLTGYSVPVNQDISRQFGIDPKQRIKSPNVMFDLFSAPKTNFDFDSSNSLKSTGTKGMGAKTGVTIIYD